MLLSGLPLRATVGVHERQGCESTTKASHVVKLDAQLWQELSPSTQSALEEEVLRKWLVMIN